MIEVTILSEGKAISGSYELHGVDIGLEFNRIPWARLSFLEGDVAKPEFNITNAADFEPGSNIEIKIMMMNVEGVKSKEEIFKGVVTGQRLELGPEQSILIVEIQDKSRCMSGGRQTRFFEQKKDSEIMSALVMDSGLQQGQWQDSVYKHEKMVQFNCTDWDFLVSRAEANGLFVAVSNGKISLLKADAAPGKTHVITYGNSDIYDLEMESDAADQFTKAIASAWDFKDQKSVSSTQAANFKPAFGNSGQSGTVKKLARPDNKLFFGGTTVVQELNTWAKASEIRSKLSMVRGRVSVPGMPGVQLGEFVDLKGLGARFNGKALISGIRHRVDPGSWATDIQLGFTSEPFWRNENIIAPPAGGLLPGINGLQIGVVITTFEDDPNKEFRVGVKLLPADDDGGIFVWARLSMPDGGKGRGWFFYPEPGDEVVLGFLNGDPRQAILLGGLFSSNNTPPQELETLDNENAKKGIVTRSGHSLLFDDKEKLITISTSKKNKIVMDDNNQKIEVSDEHGNVITMSEDGISIKSQKAINFEADSNKLIMDKNGIQIKSGQKMTLEASATMEIKGAQIDLK